MYEARRFASAVKQLHLPTRSLEACRARYETRLGIYCLRQQRSTTIFSKRAYATLKFQSGNTEDLREAYRSHIAQSLSTISKIPQNEILSRLRSSPRPDSDFTLPAAGLVVHGRPATSEHASAWASQFLETQLVERPTVFGSTLDFKLKAEALTHHLIPRILSQKNGYGTHPKLGLKNPIDPASGKKRVLVEFSSPNIAKPFHAGHLRSTILGGFLANIYEAAGWEVVRYNFLGDWGRQFGLLAIGFQRYGSTSELATNPIGHLFDVYVMVNRDAEVENKNLKTKKRELAALSLYDPELDHKKAEIEADTANCTYEEARKLFVRMEQGDSDALSIWKQFRDLSIERYAKTYARLNIRYDFYAGESGVKPEEVDAVIETLARNGPCESDDGGLLMNFERLEGGKRLGKAVLRKRDGSSIYLSRDVGEAIKRSRDHQFDKMLYVVASQQEQHMAQLLKLLEVAGRDDVASKSTHVSFGMVRGMSTRKGTVKFLDDILQEARDKMHDVMQRNKEKYSEISDPERTADILGISAVMIQDMKGKRFAFP